MKTDLQMGKETGAKLDRTYIRITKKKSVYKTGRVQDYKRTTLNKCSQGPTKRALEIANC